MYSRRLTTHPLTILGLSLLAALLPNRHAWAQG